MRTKTINIYSFNELSKEAKENALTKYRENNNEIFWQEETLKSLKGLFNKCNGVSLIDYSLGDYKSWIKIEFNNEEVENFSGKRAFAWIENNLLFNIRIAYCGNYRKELRQYGADYYANKIKPCPFTGYCADEDFLESLLNDIKEGCNLKTAFEGLASIYQKLINAEMEYQNSEEYISEHFEANEYEFDEEGNMI